jgi:hypothetical protein
MYVCCVHRLDLDIEKVNVNSGATATGFNALERRDGKITAFYCMQQSLPPSQILVTSMWLRNGSSRSICSRLIYLHELQTNGICVTKSFAKSSIY